MLASVHEPLSARQAEIAGFVARGKSTREIAAALMLSPRTVDNHIAAIFNKLGVGTRTELVSALWRSGLETGADTKTPQSAAKTNLPAARTNLLARGDDIAAITLRLTHGRLVTVTGAGGVGKTRAALAAGEKFVAEVIGGVWFVPLAPLESGTFVAAAIARALEIQESTSRSLQQTLVAHLNGKPFLLILDNCEHVIADVAAVVDHLLGACPRLQILATSREPLRVAGEQTYRLPSLPVPAAIELFVARAQAGDNAFTLNDANAAAVTEICRRLDGIPLAIELAAARVSSLTVEALSKKLKQCFVILTGGDRAALPRHQTMRALIDWSYDLLPPAEQRMFERLSVFAGGCDLGAAAAISAGDTDEDAVLALLASLVDKSLVIADLNAAEPRYLLFESTRQYAADKLAARGEGTPIARRHAQAYVALAERLERSENWSRDSERARALRELDNWRSALSWTLEARGDVVLGQRLAAALYEVWTLVSLIEGRRWIGLALEFVNDDTPALVRARLEFAATAFAMRSGEWEVVISESRRLTGICRELGASAEATILESWAGCALVCSNRSAAGEPMLVRALEQARSARNRRLVLAILSDLAYARSVAGDIDGTRAYIWEARQLAAALGASSSAINTTLILAEAEFRHGNVEHARELALAALTKVRKTQDTRRIMGALINLAAYATVCERWDEARAAAREALGLSQETQRNVYHLWALQHMAAAVALSSATTMPRGTAERAARIVGFVDARIQSLASMREFTEQQEYDRLRSKLDDVLGAAQMAQCLLAGSLLTQDEATVQALALDADCDRPETRADSVPGSEALA